MRSYTLYCILVILILLIFVYLRDQTKENFVTTENVNGNEQSPSPATTDSSFKLPNNKLIKYNINTIKNGSSVDFMTIDNFYEFIDETSIIFFNPTNETYTIKFFLNIDTTAVNLQHIANSKTLGGEPIWSLNYHNGFFYLQLGDDITNKDTQYKFNINYDSIDSTNTEIVLIIISYTPNENNEQQLVCSIHGEITKLTTSTTSTTSTTPTKTTQTNQKVIFGSNRTDIEDKLTEDNPIRDDMSNSNSKFELKFGDIYIEDKFYSETFLQTIINQNFITCKYEPLLDMNENECHNQCMAKNNCDRYSCTQICSVKGESPPIKIRTDADPDPPNKIRVIQKNKGLTIEFKKPVYGGVDNAVISYYIIIVNKLDSKVNDTKFYTVHATDDSNCKYEIESLDDNTPFNISVLSKNNKGIISSTASEPEIVTILNDNEEATYNNELCNDSNKKYKFQSNILDKEEITNLYKDNKTLSSHLTKIFDDTTVENPIYKSQEKTQNELSKILKDLDNFLEQ